jgi:hypothetical protein
VLLGATWGLKLIGDIILKGVSLDQYSRITNYQLCLITVTTVIFSIITLLLGASRFEALASTAAYAAVLVIFMAPVPLNAAVNDA